MLIRTAVAAGVAGVATMTAGALAHDAPTSSWENPIMPKERLIAAGIGMGGMYGGIFTALTAPGKSLKPIGGVLAAGMGGILLGMHVLGPLLKGRGGD